MLNGVVPFESDVPTSDSEPCLPTRRTEMSLLAASTASTKRRSLDSWIAPADPVGLPMPAPPVWNGDPASGVRLPSRCRAKPATVLWIAALSLT